VVGNDPDKFLLEHSIQLGKLAMKNSSYLKLLSVTISSSMFIIKIQCIIVFKGGIFSMEGNSTSMVDTRCPKLIKTTFPFKSACFEYSLHNP
jgi:hypothetical protein